MPKLFDVHTHIQFAAFNEDREAVIQRALDAGVWLINVGTQKDTSAKAVEIAHKYPKGVWATIGLHPIHTESSYHDEQELGVMSGELPGFVSKGEDFDYGFFLQLSQDPRVVAIGECGFDFYRLNPGTKRKQKKIFMRHIELAYVSKKPLMIHCRSGVPERASPQNGAGRSGVPEPPDQSLTPSVTVGAEQKPLRSKASYDAFEYLLKVLNSQKGLLNSPPGVIHFFSGNTSDAQKLLDLGFSFSFGGVTTFTSDYDEVIKCIPLERILLETDAPYVAPTPYRGKRNEPEFIMETAKRIAEIKGLDFEAVASTTTQNALKLFKIN